MKPFIRLGAALLAALLLLTGCGKKDEFGETTAGSPSPTEPVAPADTEPADTEPETEPSKPSDDPDESAVELVAHTLTAVDSGVTLTFEAVLAEDAAAGSIVLCLSDADGEIAREEKPLADGAHTMTLACPADRLSGALTLTVTATEGNKAATAMTLKLKNKLPQLTPDGVRCVVSAMTPEEKANLITGCHPLAKEGASGGTYSIERLGVPATHFMDGTAGIRYGQSVWYPAVINVASTWDTALATRVGESLGEDALAHGFDIVLAPGLNLQKNVLCGRNFEYASEDPVLAGLMIAPYVNGIESTGAGTALKHYAVNNQESSRTQISADLTERALREIYLRAFGIVVKDAQPMTIMSSYNRVNGTYTAASGDLLNGILREEFGFAGMVMSDWGAGGTIEEKLNAGNDINMPGWEEDVANVLAALESGKVKDAVLDAACVNILTMVARSATAQGLQMNTRVDFAGNGKVADEAAADSMVLLRNENATLPLSAGTSLAVFGNASVATFYGGFGAASVTPRVTVSILNGLEAHEKLSVVNCKDSPFLGCGEHDFTDPSKDVEVTEAYAREMAKAADVGVIVIGRNSIEGTDCPSGKGGFLLNDTESAMVERVSAAFHAQGKRVVVLINTGSPIEVASWRDRVDAVLWVGYPGQSAGDAVARVLAGDVNPSAKTTISWPLTYASTPAYAYFPGSAENVTYYEDIYVGYRYYETFDVETAYPFGYGLSYTTFGYRDYTVTEQADGTLRATVTVTNTGNVPGREVVELYVTKPETSQEQAARELCGFAKTSLLAPGDSETVTVDIRPEALLTYDTADSRWVLDAGDYTYSLGSSAATLLGKKTVTVSKAVTVLDVENRCEPQVDLSYICKETYQVPTLRDNLLLGSAIVSNFDESGAYAAAHAVDGDYTTRWSGFGLASADGPHTLDIDMGESHTIGEFCIRWESVSAPFTVLYSTDGRQYTELGTYLDDGSKVTRLNLYGAEARYIRMVIQCTGGFLSIYEIEAHAATEADIEAGKDQPANRENLAKDQTVTASGVEGSYAAENAVDGDITTRWGSLPSGEGWIVVDLGEAMDIAAVQIHLEAAWVPYYVEYSLDGQAYTAVYEGKKDELQVKCEDLAIKARYIRVRREGSNWFSIYEILVYGA